MTLFDVISNDTDVAISVWPTLFMPYTKSMEKLMYDYPDRETAATQCDGLFPAPSLHTNIGGTATAICKLNSITIGTKLKLQACFLFDDSYCVVDYSVL